MANCGGGASISGVRVWEMETPPVHLLLCPRTDMAPCFQTSRKLLQRRGDGPARVCDYRLRRRRRWSPSNYYLRDRDVDRPPVQLLSIAADELAYDDSDYTPPANEG